MSLRRVIKLATGQDINVCHACYDCNVPLAEEMDVPLGSLVQLALSYGTEAHPSEEHFLPLFVALGAAEDERPARHQPRFAYGSLVMDAYVW